MPPLLSDAVLLLLFAVSKNGIGTRLATHLGGATAVQRGGDDLKGLKDFHLEASPGSGHDGLVCAEFLSDTMYSFTSFRKSKSPPTRQLK